MYRLSHLEDAAGLFQPLLLLGGEDEGAVEAADGPLHRPRPLATPVAGERQHQQVGPHHQIGMIVLEGGAAADDGSPLAGDLAGQRPDHLRVHPAHLRCFLRRVVGQPLLEELEYGHHFHTATVLQLHGVRFPTSLNLQRRLYIPQGQGG